MKKTVCMILILVLVITIGVVVHFRYEQSVLAKQQQIQQEYEQLKESVVTGNTLATLMNKTIDRNAKKETQIEIEIQFLEADTPFTMEQIANKGMENFIKHYSMHPFQCTKIDYEGKQIKTVHIEEVESF